MSPRHRPVKKRLCIISIALALLLAVTLPSVAEMERVTDFPGVPKSKPQPPVGPPKVVEVKDLTVDHYVDDQTVYLSGQEYKFSASTEFSSAGAKRIGRMDLRKGDVVDVVYYTNRPQTEVQVFKPTDKVLTKVSVVGRGK